MNPPSSDDPSGNVAPLGPAPDASAALAAPAVPAGPPAEAFTPAELRALLQRPDRSIELLLGQRERVVATIAGNGSCWPLTLALLGVTTLAALPYGVVLGGAAGWKVAVLFAGTVLLAWPSLQVFGSYFGASVRPAQSLTLALVVACVASLFTLGFAPIQWFLQATMQEGDWLDASDLSRLLLTVALFAGLGQLTWCAGKDARLRGAFVLLLVWQLLVVLLALRMARALGLLP